MREGVGARLKTVREELGLSLRAMAERVDVALSTWQRLETTDNVPSGETLLKITELGFNPGWILTGQGPMHQDDISEAHLIENGDYVMVPRLDVAASAGGGAFDDLGENVLHHLAFRKEWFRELGLDPNKAEILSAAGDSMEPSISNGDIILVDRSITKITDDGVYVLVVNNNLFVKRLLTRMDGTIIVKSDNPAYPEDTFSAEAAANLKIIGRVRWIGKYM